MVVRRYQVLLPVIATAVQHQRLPNTCLHSLHRRTHPHLRLRKTKRRMPRKITRRRGKRLLEINPTLEANFISSIWILAHSKTSMKRLTPRLWSRKRRKNEEKRTRIKKGTKKKKGRKRRKREISWIIPLRLFPPTTLTMHTSSSGTTFTAIPRMKPIPHLLPVNMFFDWKLILKGWKPTCR